MTATKSGTASRRQKRNRLPPGLKREKLLSIKLGQRDGFRIADKSLRTDRNRPFGIAFGRAAVAVHGNLVFQWHAACRFSPQQPLLPPTQLEGIL